MADICVLGLGYIGLPTASVLASGGHGVLGVDIDAGIVATVNAGGIHIEEPGLRTVVNAAIHSGNLRAATAPEPSEVFIIAVPTPLAENKRADLSYVRHAAQELAACLKPGDLVILESTSPPGTTRDLLAPMLAEATGLKPGEDFHLAHCPERVMPGRILKELIENDRVVGGFTPACAERARDVYASFVEGKIILTDATTAEMVKVLENTYRDVNIALANEAALLCEELRIDFAEVGALANRHPRVHLHKPGPGVGGHCISVDPWFLVERFPENARLIRHARERNDAMPEHVIAETLRMLAGVESPCVAVLGVAFKGNVDDTRESPAIDIVAGLRDRGVEVRPHDPLARRAPFELADLDTALRGADVLLLLTDHDAFRAIAPDHAARLMRGRCVYDTRSLLNRPAWEAEGFTVQVLGSGR
ncbi:MAG: nucleotide sugar dehydrogenase [Candidatus Hydrogenedens sp.]|nr:nucleotide sugar dehydrogenase [Candidatus Hydrogenedens sp.]